MHGTVKNIEFVILFAVSIGLIVFCGLFYVISKRRWSHIASGLGALMALIAAGYFFYRMFWD